jgi:hypothetical protein
VLEIGLGGSYLDWDNETRGLTLEDDGPVMETEGGWSSDHALGFDAAVRSLSPDRGLQVALYFSYANLRPVTKTPFTVGVKRRRASVDVGWRLTTPKTDDLVLGFTASWQTDTDLRVTQWEVYDATSDHEEVKLGKLGVFLSGEREVLEGLRIRGGVRGLISFRDFEETYKTTYSGVDRELQRDTFNASIDSPVFYLGAGYRWRGLDFEARVRESVNLDAPVTRWSVGMTF